MTHIALLQKLIQFKSITPNDDGALEYLRTLLTEMGFTCELIEFSEAGYDDVKNLYARIGDTGHNFCFAGHIDVVPVGKESDWRYPPFAGEIHGGIIHGRGAIDMKGAIAAFLEALKRLMASAQLNIKSNSISLLITADEEGIAINGTKKMIQWLEGRGEKIDLCLIGEPTSTAIVGDTIKVGARGSVTLVIEVFGKQGHVAYHEIAENPIPKLAQIITALKSINFDNGNVYFQASNLEFTDLYVGNIAENVIPSAARAQCNIRFGDMHTAESLANWVEGVCNQHTANFKVTWHSSGEAFLTKHDLIAPVTVQAIQKIAKIAPKINTLGGTSDARFLTKYCQVLELGLLNETAHKVDEYTTFDDLEILTQIYMEILKSY